MNEPIKKIKGYLKFKTTLRSKSCGAMMIELLDLLKVQDYDLDAVGLKNSISITTNKFKMMLIENEESLNWEDFNKPESSVSSLTLFVARATENFSDDGVKFSITNREVELAKLERICQTYEQS